MRKRTRVRFFRIFAAIVLIAGLFNPVVAATENVTLENSKVDTSNNVENVEEEVLGVEETENTKDSETKIPDQESEKDNNTTDENKDNENSESVKKDEGTEAADSSKEESSSRESADESEVSAEDPETGIKDTGSEEAIEVEEPEKDASSKSEETKKDDSPEVEESEADVSSDVEEEVSSDDEDLNDNSTFNTSAENSSSIFEYGEFVGNMISPNGDGKHDTSSLKFKLNQDAEFGLYVYDAMNPKSGPYGNGIIGEIKGVTSYTGGIEHSVTIDGTFTPFSSNKKTLDDSVYLAVAVGDEGSYGEIGPLIVKSSAPEIVFDSIDDVINASKIDIKGKITDKFIDYLSVIDFRLHDVLEANWQLIDEKNEIIDKGNLFIWDAEDTEFDINLKELTTGNYTLKVKVQDALGNATEETLPITIVFDLPDDISEVVTEAYLANNVVSSSNRYTYLHVNLTEEVKLMGIVWDALNPTGGPLGDGTLGAMLDENFQHWNLSKYGPEEDKLFTGTPYCPYDWGWIPCVWDLADGVYTIQLSAMLDNMFIDGKIEVGPYFVKKSSGTIEFDPINGPIEQTSLTGNVSDKFIEWAPTIREVYDPNYDVNEHLFASYKVVDKQNQIVKEGSLRLNQDGTFTVPIGGLTAGKYTVTVKTGDAGNNEPTEKSVTFEVVNGGTPTDPEEPEEFDINLTPSTTEETDGVITVSVSTNSDTEITSLKWLKGNKTVDDFTDAGNEIDVNNPTFQVEENGTYTIFARNFAGVTAVSTITITNIKDPDPEQPVDPDPEQPVDPDPEQPVDPDPEQPVDPDPEQPVDPDPEQPVDPDPEQPVDPDPEQPVDPDPEQPVDPDPEEPGDPTPEQPGKPNKPEQSGDPKAPGKTDNNGSNNYTSKTDTDGKQLPNTSTQTFNLLSIGVTLLMIGGLLSFIAYRRRRGTM